MRFARSWQLKHLTPSPSTVYRITQRYGLNRLTPKLREEKRRIVKQKAGELGHLDCHLERPHRESHGD